MTAPHAARPATDDGAALRAEAEADLRALAGPARGAA